MSSRPLKLEGSKVDAWLSSHPGWERSGEAVTRTLKLADFSAALAFAVRIGCWAEKRDHHPDLEIGWGRAKITWSTHDAGGITALDLELAEKTDEISA
jgi:4a-hydroxytetrahydrobiopterin dehydratase